MSNALRPDKSIVDDTIEGAGYLWRVVEADFAESAGITDELLVQIQFQNEDGETRSLKMALSRAAACTDTYGRYKIGVRGKIQDWLWTDQQHGHIRFMGDELEGSVRK